jgi:hypothetical protein
MNNPVIYRITSGDPSRGHLSVETVKDLPVGLYMQFMKISSDQSTYSTDSLIEFKACREEDLYNPPLSQKTSRFSVQSEGGFIFSKPNQKGRNAVSGSLISEIPGSSITLLNKCGRPF